MTLTLTLTLTLVLLSVGTAQAEPNWVPTPATAAELGQPGWERHEAYCRPGQVAVCVDRVHSKVYKHKRRVLKPEKRPPFNHGWRTLICGGRKHTVECIAGRTPVCRGKSVVCIK